MSEKRRGLGRGLGALIPSSPVSEAPESAEGQGSQAKKRTQRPVDVFFPASSRREDADAAILTTTDSETVSGSSAAQMAEVLRAPRRTTPNGSKKPAAKKPAAKRTAQRTPLILLRPGVRIPAADTTESNAARLEQPMTHREDQQSPSGNGCFT